MNPALVELLMDSGAVFPTWRPRVPEWRARAACIGVDPNVMVPRVEKDETVAEAVAVCAGCDVRPECLVAALADPTLVGVWGGLTTRQRRELRAEKGVA